MMISKSLLLLLVFTFVQPSWSMCRSTLSGSEAAGLPVTQSSELKLGETFENLASQGFLLKQEAQFLPKSLCGGTCGSTSMVNMMLALAEAIVPGRISQLSKVPAEGSELSPLQQLQHDLLDTLIEKVKSKFTVNPLKGTHNRYLAYFFVDVFTTYFEAGDFNIDFGANFKTHFGDTESVDLSVNSLGYVSVMLSLGERRGGHGIVVTHVGQSESHAEGFIYRLSDPHRPEVIAERSVVSRDGKIILEGYEDVLEFPVLVVRKGKAEDGYIWHHERYKELVENSPSPDTRYDITYKSGYKLKQVKLIYDDSNFGYLTYLSRFTETEREVFLEDIETIVISD